MVLIDIRSKTPRTNGTRKESNIKKIARHHSATDSGSWETFWPFWHNTRGWGTGGYHEIILRNGDVQLCYDPNEITNGVANHNSTTYHICVVGNGSFTEAQERAFDERCKLAMKRFRLFAEDVLGHNEFSGASTTCPGIDMNMVRRRLLMGATVATTQKPVKEDEEMQFSSGTLKRTVEDLLNSPAKQKQLIEDGIKAGSFSSVWRDNFNNKKLAPHDILGLYMLHHK